MFVAQLTAAGQELQWVDAGWRRAAGVEIGHQEQVCAALSGGRWANQPLGEIEVTAWRLGHNPRPLPQTPTTCK